jgi:hypothetical protein
MEQLGPYQQERSVIIFIKPKRDGKRGEGGTGRARKKE